jgi:DNA-binding NarL/FixJ family response regulator
MRVMIISASPLARVGLAALLSDFTDCEVIGEAASFEDLPDDLPDVLLWDLSWGVDFGTLHVSVPIVALIADEADVGEVRRAGISGILSTDSSPEQIHAAMLAVMQDLVVADPVFVPALTPPEGEVESLKAPLTPREQEVLRLLAEGLPNKNIALQLGVSEHTVKFHINAIFSKLGVQSRTEAVVKAMKLGLIVV